MKIEEYERYSKGTAYDLKIHRAICVECRKPILKKEDYVFLSQHYDMIKSSNGEYYVSNECYVIYYHGKCFTLVAGSINVVRNQ